MYAVTFGEGLERPQGQSRDVPPPPIAGLAGVLRSQPARVERWWSVHSWERNYRTAAGWKSSIGVAVDIDYKVKGEAPPAQVAARLADAARTGELPGSIFHLTPHGARAVFIYDLACSHRALQISASKGAAALVERKLAELDLFDYEIDPCTWDLGRLYFTPNSVAKGVARHDEIITMRERPYEVDELAAEEPPEEEPAPAPVPRKPIPISRAFEDAVSQWNADHRQDWPRKPGECPACQHKGCFHFLPGDESRWVCFSSNHTSPGLSSTKDGVACYHGDALDLEAYARGCRTVDVLRSDGYMSAPKPPRALPAGGAAAVEPIPDPEPDPEPVAFRPWRSHSYLTAVSIIRDNARDVLESRKLELNEMTGRVELNRQALRDVDVSRIRSLIEARFVGSVSKDNVENGLQLSKDDIFSAVDQVASESAYHPVRDYLSLLVWDGVERLDAVCEDLLGAHRTPLHQAMVRRFFLSAVARAFQPGCKVDTMFILVGPQGAMKSTFFRLLAGDEWFVDSPIDIQHKDAYQQLRTAWIIEWAELESLFRARDSTSVKAFLSSCTDTYRPSYSRQVISVPRSCVIVGSTNQDEFLTDETGNRRFWPLRVGAIAFEHVATQRDQLWAEAVAKFKAGEKWWFTPAEEVLLHVSHEEYRVRDSWEERVVGWASGILIPFSTGDVLQKALEKPAGQWTRADEMRVSRILKASGWKRRTDPDDKHKKVWAK